MNSEIKRSLESLVADLIDGNLDTVRREQLNHLLRDSEQCRRHFNAIMDVQCGITSLASQSQDSGAQNQGGVDRLSNAMTSAEKTNAEVIPNHFAFRSTALPWSITLLSLAALLVITISFVRRAEFESSDTTWLASSNVKDREIQNGVLLVDASSAEYFDTGPTLSGEILQLAREYVLTSGTIRLAFHRGAEVILESPSVFTAVDADRLSVKLGRCSVHVPEGAEGFRVETPQTEVIDLGTRFSVDVNEAGLTDVQMIEGSAEVRKLSSTAKRDVLLLTDGQARRFGDDKERFGEVIPFESSSYAKTLPDRVVSYEAVGQSELISDLAAVTVQRGGVLREYNVNELIGIEVLCFVPEPDTLNVTVSASSGPGVRDVIESDHSLVTGLINPGGAKEALASSPITLGDTATPGFGFRFRHPVVNGPGPDVVLFDIQNKADPPTGDGFHVSPLVLTAQHRAHSIQRYDIAMKSAEAKPTEGFELLLFAKDTPLVASQVADHFGSRPTTLQFYALAVGIDLSDLGYSYGEACDGLFIQDDLADCQLIDPTFIAGLPEWTEEEQ